MFFCLQVLYLILSIVLTGDSDVQFILLLTTKALLDWMEYSGC